MGVSGRDSCIVSLGDPAIEPPALAGNLHGIEYSAEYVTLVVCKFLLNIRTKAEGLFHSLPYLPSEMQPTANLGSMLFYKLLSTV